MDFQRNFLFIALLAVSFFLFISWQKDYGQAATPSAVPAASTSGASPASAPQQAASTGKAAGSDFAGLSPAPAQATAVATSPAATVSGNRVHVRTDVFDMAIDLNGGDVIDLRLPKYPQSLDTPDRSVQLMTNGSSTYLAQSGLKATQGTPVDTETGRATYSAESREFVMADGQDTLEVVLHLPEHDGVTIEKVFRFRRGDYLVDVDWRIRNSGNAPWSGFVWGQLKRDESADPSHSNKGFLGGTSSYLGGAYYSDEKPYNKISFKDAREQPLDASAQGGWIGFLQHYFISAWIPDQKQRNNYATVYQQEQHTYLYRFTSPPVSVTPGTTREIGAAFYAGPKQQERLARISKGLDRTVDYGALWFIAQILFWLMVHIHALVGNWGISIILLTVLVKVAFYYPSHVSYRSMANMRRITPELMRLREEHKNDRQKQAQEMMNLYRREKVNPLGGCLPILVQMPIFLSLYWVLMEAVELRQAPFFFWIHDLSVMDPYFILPVLMGISMFVQTKLNPAPPDPMQAKMMQFLPWVFTLFFLFFASGLVLYWLVNNILSISQQWFITRQVEKQFAKT